MNEGFGLHAQVAGTALEPGELRRRVGGHDPQPLAAPEDFNRLACFGHLVEHPIDMLPEMGGGDGHAVRLSYVLMLAKSYVSLLARRPWARARRYLLASRIRVAN